MLDGTNVLNTLIAIVMLKFVMRGLAGSDFAANASIMSVAPVLKMKLTLLW